jgi:hypothetical protein
MVFSAIERWRGRLAAGGIALAWLALQGALLVAMGVRRGGDSGRYLSAARDLLDGALPAGKAVSYLGYDAFVAVFLGVGLGPASVVAAQIALSGTAGWCLYRIGETTFDARAGTIAAALFLLYPSLQMWNVYLLTESLFVSSVVIAAWLLIRARGPWGYVAAVAAVGFATLVRPHGVVVPAAALAFVVARMWTEGRRAAAWTLVGAVACLAPFAYMVVGQMLAFENPLAHFLSGTVIWGADTPRLHAPVGAGAGSPSDNPIAQTLQFAAQEPVYFTRLAAAKLFWFFARGRPYYSDLHNAFIAATLVPLYLLALRGAFVRMRRPAVRWLLLGIWLLPALVAALTFADWDSRHSLVTLPVVFLLAGAGWSSFRRKDEARRE